MHGKVLRSDVSTVSGHAGTLAFVPEGPFTALSSDDGSYVFDEMPEGVLRIAFFRGELRARRVHRGDARLGQDLTMRDVTLHPVPPGPVDPRAPHRARRDGALGNPGSRQVELTDLDGLPTETQPAERRHVSRSARCPASIRSPSRRSGTSPRACRTCCCSRERTPSATSPLIAGLGRRRRRRRRGRRWPRGRARRRLGRLGRLGRRDERYPSGGGGAGGHGGAARRDAGPAHGSRQLRPARRRAPHLPLGRRNGRRGAALQRTTRWSRQHRPSPSAPRCRWHTASR